MSGVKVANLPRDVTDKEIKIYFSKPENGGGKVRQIYYPLHGNAAAVLFADRDVADIIAAGHLTGRFRQALVEKLPDTQMYTKLTAELDTQIAEYLQAMPDVLDEIQFGSDMVYHHDTKRNIYTLQGNWYQLEWAWKHVEDVMWQQSTAHSRIRSRAEYMNMDTDDHGREPPPREAVRAKGCKPIIHMPGSESTVKSARYKETLGRHDEEQDSSDENEPSGAVGETEENVVDPVGRDRTAAAGKQRSQTVKTAKDAANADKRVSEHAKEAAGDKRGGRILKDKKLTEILNDKPDDPRSLDFRHGHIHVSIYTGNITLSETDAIVNASNEFLTHAGGVAFAIASAASPKMKDECERHIDENGYLRVADVMHTCAGGKMSPKVKHIIHAVGPIWSRQDDVDDRSAYQLTRTFLNILTYANKCLKIKSVTMPLISSGVFGGSLEGCVMAFFKAILIFVRDHCEGPMSLEEVHLINNNSESTVVTVTQIRECLGQELDQLTDTARQEFDKMSVEEDVVRRRAASSRGTDLSTSVRTERYKSMPSSLTGTNLSRSTYTPGGSSGPTSLGSISTRSRSSEDDMSLGDIKNHGVSSYTSTEDRPYMRSLSSGQSSALGSPERLQLPAGSKPGHMTSSSQSEDRLSPESRFSSEDRTTIPGSETPHQYGRRLPPAPSSSYKKKY